MKKTRSSPTPEINPNAPISRDEIHRRSSLFAKELHDLMKKHGIPTLMTVSRWMIDTPDGPVDGFTSSFHGYPQHAPIMAAFLLGRADSYAVESLDHFKALGRRS